MKITKLNKRELYILIFLGILFLGSLLFILIPKNTSKGNTYVININNIQVKTGPLNIEDHFTMGKYPLKIQVKNGSISVVDSKCPNHFCQEEGQISNVNESITCLPNNLIIKVKGAYDPTYDGSIR